MVLGWWSSSYMHLSKCKTAFEKQFYNPKVIKNFSVAKVHNAKIITQENNLLWERELAETKHKKINKTKEEISVKMV